MYYFFFLSEKVSRTLPWTPKVRQKDLDSFLDYTRMKFVGKAFKNIPYVKDKGSRGTRYLPSKEVITFYQIG